MRSKQIYRRGKFIAAGVIVLTLLFGGKAYSTEVQAAELERAVVNNAGGGQAEINKAKTAWYFKIVDGKLYKRLRNDSSGKWLTDWILCP